MEEAGSSMNNIIKTTILMHDLKDYPLMRKTELEILSKACSPLVISASEHGHASGSG